MISTLILYLLSQELPYNVCIGLIIKEYIPMILQCILFVYASSYLYFVQLEHRYLRL